MNAQQPGIGSHVQELIRCLIQRRQTVVEFLAQKHCYERFCEEIQRWREEYVEKDCPFESTVQELLRIAGDYGITALCFTAGGAPPSETLAQPPARASAARPEAPCLGAGVRSRGTVLGREQGLEEGHWTARLAAIGKLYAPERR